jgi:Na+-transporting NADH:ubiquinone oxidoreductase subunit C
MDIKHGPSYAIFNIRGQVRFLFRFKAVSAAVAGIFFDPVKAETITVDGEYDGEDYTYTFYEDKASGTITFGFGPTFGGGVWGPIIGLLSLENDFTTIVRISVLQQEETPGLGGIVATRAYLDTFEGKTIGLGDDAISIIKDLDVLTAATNEVRSITGATRTSTQFDIILNNAYAAHRLVWEARA